MTGAARPSAGSVSLIGAGPGDPELLTLRAARRLAAAEVVLYDRLVSAEILALANPQAEFIYAGKEKGQQDEVQQEIFRHLALHAGAGKRVVRLKSGDPLVFGRGAEEAEYLLSLGIAVEIVPGISSAIAVPGQAGIPVTYRSLSSSFTVVTGHARKNGAIDWRSHAAAETLIILMGVETRVEIAQALIAAGRAASEPVAFISRGCTASETTVETTLAEVAAGNVAVESPAIFIAGEVVRLRERLKEVTAHGLAVA